MIRKLCSQFFGINRIVSWHSQFREILSKIFSHLRVFLKGFMSMYSSCSFFTSEGFFEFLPLIVKTTQGGGNSLSWTLNSELLHVLFRYIMFSFDCSEIVYCSWSVKFNTLGNSRCYFFIPEDSFWTFKINTEMIQFAKYKEVRIYLRSCDDVRCNIQYLCRDFSDRVQISYHKVLLER